MNDFVSNAAYNLSLSLEGGFGLARVAAGLTSPHRGKLTDD
jgi:hypothetical protein